MTSASDRDVTAARHAINLDWLIRLRWFGLAGAVLLALGGRVFLGLHVPFRPLLAVLIVDLMANLLMGAASRRHPPRDDRPLALVLAVDVMKLTALLHLTGGAGNPFSFLYLMQVTLAAVTLRPARAYLVTGFALAAYGLLFLLPPWEGRPIPHYEHLRLHLEGMLLAFVMSALFVVYFVQRVSGELERREAELAAARREARRNERVSSLATLAAGAAHELSTPLSTIAVVARELERSLGSRKAAASGEAEASDVRLIRDEVERCRDILHQLAADVGQGTGEALQILSVARLVELVLGDPAVHGLIRRQVDPQAAAAVVEVTPRMLTRALRGILKNAVQASAPGQPIEFVARLAEGRLQLQVTDHGEGMPMEVLERVGEPFYTTKSPGEGMGLGLFLARSVLRRLDGELTVSSSPGEGTTVTMELPLADPDRRPQVSAEVDPPVPPGVPVPREGA